MADDYLEAVDELIEAARAVLECSPGPRGFETAFGRLQRAVDVLTLDDPPAEPRPLTAESVREATAKLKALGQMPAPPEFGPTVERVIARTNQIQRFMHCRTCMPRKPDHLSPREWVRIEAGLTPVGIQVWCVRCEKNMVHVDFEGHKHPAAM